VRLTPRIEAARAAIVRRSMAFLYDKR